ncbi:deoxycytidine triphosphate deaminase [Calothrix sp. NIES-2100]|uniref:dCTP deaminase n=1 Tax=Calothrix sp. NIES-2100 TaxID=1954172 RepID=UPI000B5E31A0|nr:deoxycytidine triphosphate deaminase [Calothrix sp. NIES-2100]
MTIKSDRWISEQGSNLINPFCNSLIRKQDDLKVISYGLSSYGYDIRLSGKDFRIFKHIPGQVVDPKNFDPKFLEKADLYFNDDGSKYFIIPGNSYALGVAKEFLDIPDDVTVICIGKSTYARVGLIANLTPGEAGWKGHLTLEISNSSNSDCIVYADEGIVQLLFFQSDEKCLTTYEARNGKYQNQSEQITIAKV